VLTKDDGGVELLGKSSCNKSRIFIKSLNCSFVTGVEKDGSRFIWIKRLVDDVAECKSLRSVASCIEMVQASLEGFGQWTLVISFNLIEALSIPNASISESFWIGFAPQGTKTLHLAHLDQKK